MAVRAVLATVGIVAALAAITHPWKALSQSAQPVIPLINGTPGGTSGNPVNVTGSFSSTTTGFPTTQTTGTPISVTTGGVTGTLPSGTVVVAANVGTTNIAYCKLGASATTSDQAIAPNGGWFAFTVGASTQLTCITSTSTTTVNMVGGSGLPTGTGGGGGGSGGAVTMASSAVVANAYLTGAIVDLGRTDDSVCGTATGTCSLIALQKYNNNATNSAIPAGTAAIGTVGQTGMNYETVAAGVTAQALGATGAAGDYLSHCTVYPTTTTPGVVTVFDGTSTTTNNVITFPGGASSISNLVPFAIPVGATSLNSGGWKVTTGSNLLVICYGRFT
jgi:hypothetical protein